MVISFDPRVTVQNDRYMSIDGTSLNNMRENGESTKARNSVFCL